MELGVGGRFEGPVDGAELHVVSQFWDTLTSVLNVGAAVVHHDVSIAAGASWWVVNGSALGAEKGDCVMGVHFGQDVNFI